VRKGILVSILLVLCTGDGFTQEPEFNGRKLSEWVAKLKQDQNPRLRMSSVLALSQIALANPETTPLVASAFAQAIRTDASVSVRRAAAKSFRSLNLENSTGGLQDLIASARTEQNEEVVNELMGVLGRYGERAKDAVTTISERMLSGSLRVQITAAESLGRIGEPAPIAYPVILKLLENQLPEARRAAVFALGRIPSKDSDKSADLLAKMLTDEKDSTLVCDGLVSLRLLGKTTPDVITFIKTMASHRDVMCRRELMMTLRAIGMGDQQVDESLINVLKNDSDLQIRQLAVTTIFVRLKNNPGNVIQVLSEPLKKDNAFQVRVVILEQLASLGAEGASALPLMRDAQKDPNPRVREAATSAIRRVEQAAQKK
jgi:HEAT repeat protein